MRRPRRAMVRVERVLVVVGARRLFGCERLSRIGCVRVWWCLCVKRARGRGAWRREGFGLAEERRRGTGVAGFFFFAALLSSPSAVSRAPGSFSTLQGHVWRFEGRPRAWRERGGGRAAVAACARERERAEGERRRRRPPALSSLRSPTAATLARSFISAPPPRSRLSRAAAAPTDHSRSRVGGPSPLPTREERRSRRC
jgi:hypothetical protein